MLRRLAKQNWNAALIGASLSGLFIAVMAGVPGSEARLIGPPGTGREFFWRDSNQGDIPLSQRGTVEAFQRDCENGVQKWRTAQVDYPKELSIAVNDSVTYNAAVDIRDAPLPADDVIVASGSTGFERIDVKCRLAARLTAVGAGIKIDGDSVMVNQEFTPLGVVEWSWSVTAIQPVDQELRLEVRPAILVTREDPDPNPERLYATDTEASFVTPVKVRATEIDHLKYWFDNQWPLLLGIASALSVAYSVFRKWFRDQFRPAAEAPETLQRKKGKTGKGRKSVK
ncbi:hypothetical protein [Arthrobacter sp. H-02-3]|uniref:hypothetical protein n=1 Tax=Arthrobacter sp. H-02-3 TaxID=2703675 RepID=UPI001057ED71|nr:hypothetical protein [Arthrobacter sp. H-02-3]